MFYWIPHWSSDDLKDLNKGLHQFVIFCSLVNFLMKLAVIGMLALTQRDLITKETNQIRQNLSKGIAAATSKRGGPAGSQQLP